MKDNLSEGTIDYARFRPHYPQELYAYLESLLPHREAAWDVGTGNGQIAVELSRLFNVVHATDISQDQLNQAVKKSNIFYSKQAAEHSHFGNDVFDLYMVGQAIHWFDFEEFYREVIRTAKNNSLLVVTGYGRLKIHHEINQVLTDFYENILGPYWDPERKYVEDGYSSIPFPFAEISAPSHTINMDWDLDQLMGYLGTWSAVKHYKRKKGQDSLKLLYPALREKWGDENLRKTTFPVLLRVGKIKKN